MIMRKILFILGLLACTNSFAQRIQRSVIGSAGKVLTASTGKLSFTLGEAVAHKIQSAATLFALNQGFQQRINGGTALPVTGLLFTARREDARYVRLNWQTLQEINNKGFRIERRLDKEPTFTNRGWVSSATNDGNSTIEQQYQYADLNAYNGITYYRLRQEDRNGRFAYSLVRTVSGSANASKQLQVWPIPSNGLVNVRVNELEQADALLLYDPGGRLLQRFPIQANQVLQIRTNASGTYVVQLASDPNIRQLIIVQ
jgi:hypothetical protein